MEKLIQVNVSVPYKGPGNIIRQKPVDFDLYKVEGHYSLIPQLTNDERRIANLPESLDFNLDNGKPVPLRKNDGNFHVIEDAVQKLKELEQQLLQ